MRLALITTQARSLSGPVRYRLLDLDHFLDEETYLPHEAVGYTELLIPYCHLLRSAYEIADARSNIPT